MRLQDVLAGLRDTEPGRTAAVEVSPAAGALGAAGLATAPSDGGDPRHLVDVLDPDGEALTTTMTDVAGRLGPADLAVLLVRSSADDLPVGALLDALGAARLWAVQVVPCTAPAGHLVLVVSTDADRAPLAYLFGDEVGSGEQAARRLRNEWLVESLVLRAATLRLEGRLRGALEEASIMRTERDATRAAQQVAQQVAQDRALAAEKALRELRATAAKRPAVLTRLRDSPVGPALAGARRASRRILR